ncbi:MAG: type IV pilus assembly protein PilM [Armatimonadetes bacterium]|nr:type IV pilus assembly protein PilM [Armatimonadota bacterium]
MSLSLFKKKSFLGLDIGHHAIKGAQVEKTGSGWKVVKAFNITTPPDAVKEGIIIDPDPVGAAIKAGMKQAHIHADSAVVGVAGGSVIVRNVRIPKMNETTLRKSIRYEAGRYVPSSIEDSFIEFDIVEQDVDGQMDVLIVASPKDMVNSRVAACKAAGLDVEIVDVEAFANYRAVVEVEENNVLKELTVAMVDIGAMTTSVSVVSKGQFAMCRTIPQAGQVLTEALKTYFKLTDADAESGKTQLDLSVLLADAKVVENPPLRIVQPHIDDLIREIRRSLNYYQSQQTEQGQPNPVTHLLVSGGGAKFVGLGEYMANKLGMQVVAGGIFDNPRVTNGLLDDTERGFDLVVASGLAMRAFAKAV